MTDVTFTPEQVKEIRRRVHALPVRYMLDTRTVTFPSVRVDALLAAFPLPKVTRLRTFKWETSEYRVNGDVVEVNDLSVGWRPSFHLGGNVSFFALTLADHNAWDVLKEFADVCANRTEEVDP